MLTIPQGSVVMPPQEASEIIAQAIETGEDIILYLPDNTSTAQIPAQTHEELVSLGLALSVERAGVIVTLEADVLAEIDGMLSVEISPSAITPPQGADIAALFQIRLLQDQSPILTPAAPVGIAVYMGGLDPSQTQGIVAARLQASGVMPLLGGTLSQNRESFQFITDTLSSFAVLQGQEFTSIHLRVGSELLRINNQQSISDAPPVILNERTMVPVRLIAEAFGAEVSWDEDSRTATISQNGTTIDLPIDVAQPGMDVPATIINDRTMVPLRFVSETLGASVIWNSRISEISIYY